MQKKKNKIWLFLVIFLAIVILVYDTYNQHFANKNNFNKENLTVEYENAGNILLSNLKDGMSTSLHIKVKNETNTAKKYQLKFIEVYNDLVYKENVTYSFSKDNSTVEISSEVFPDSIKTMYDGDEIDPGETVDYVLTVKAHELNEIDFGKSLQARIILEEVE